MHGRAWSGVLVWALLVAPRASSALDASSSPHPGRIEGTVRLGPKLTERRLKFSLYADPGRAPQTQPAPDPADEFQNVVVYLQSAPAHRAASPGPSPAMAQVRMTFVPHVLPVVKGTTVEFPNEDTVFHNVFSLSKVATFDLGRFPQGTSKSVRFTMPGVVKVFCHIHSDMSAVVVVLDNPYFATPDRQGRFAIEGIPPGEYTVVAWHERARTLSRRLRVESGTPARVDFDIPLSDEPPRD